MISISNSNSYVTQVYIPETSAMHEPVQLHSLLLIMPTSQNLESLTASSSTVNRLLNNAEATTGIDGSGDAEKLKYKLQTFCS